MQYVSEHTINFSIFVYYIPDISSWGNKMDSNIPKTSYAMIDTNGK